MASNVRTASTTGPTEARRRSNEKRWRRLKQTFALLDLDPVSISTNNPAEILEAFTLWAEQRMYWRVRW